MRRKLVERAKTEWAFFLYDRERRRENRRLWIARRLPRSILYWSVVVAACRTTDSYPGDTTASDMLKALDY